ncbi:MAG: glycoside hydrolase family 1 protein [Candidatus Omnitrophota bacterium]|nr:MAG: glycoside hydrolase family 1 protein [Candidatus Omnitrophota bacterium]
MLEFPKDFYWGAATSAYQVEGNNTNSDWWQWEKSVGLEEVSGEACRHYQLFKEDFDLARSLSHNAHRLSIEWSRIEPQEGQFCEEELEHYIEVIKALKERRLEPIVTLHHFTTPVWFAQLGGWQSKKGVALFLRYIEKVIIALSRNVRFWVTINEPIVYIYFSYILGQWPPQVMSFPAARQVEKNLISCHIKAYRLIHDIYKRNNLIEPSVSIAHNMQAFVPCSHNLKNILATYLRDRIYNFSLVENLIRHRSLDFIGINYYNRSLVDVEKWRFKNLLMDVCRHGHSKLPKNFLGWDIYPEGLFTLLIKLKKYKLPVFIMENGICTEDDNLRWGFIREHLESLNLAIKKGVRVLGYIYWSLLDNFEWDKGFTPRFGLIEVDYSNFRRTVRDSARRYAEVCKSNKLI